MLKRTRLLHRGGFIIFISLIIVLMMIQAVFGIPARGRRGNPFKVPQRWARLLHISQQYGNKGRVDGYVCYDDNWDAQCTDADTPAANIWVFVTADFGGGTMYLTKTSSTGYWSVRVPFSPNPYQVDLDLPPGYDVNGIYPQYVYINNVEPHDYAEFPLIPVSTPTPTSTPTDTPTPLPSATPTSTPTPTITPTATPTPEATDTPTPTPVPNFRFWGRVQDLSGHPMGNVAVHLLARKANTDWQLVKAVNTHGNGQYFLFRWEDKGYTHYRIVVQPPSGYVPVRAEAPAPAQIIDAQTIQYVHPTPGYYQNNNFTLGVPTPTPTATPTHTPSPTPTDTPTPTPTHTPTPTPTPTPSTGSVQGYVWQDDNMDGQRQEGEKGVPDVTVRLSEQTHVQALLAWETTTDATGFYRFTDIPPGTYVLSLVSQVGLYPTTETTIEVKAEANTVAEVNFGVYSLTKHIYMPLMVK